MNMNMILVMKLQGFFIERLVLPLTGGFFWSYLSKNLKMVSSVLSKTIMCYNIKHII